VSVAMMKFWFYQQYVYTGYLMLFGTILTALSTSRCMTHEKEQASLALLHTTTLSSWRIVIGKLMANCRYVAVLVGLLMVPALTGSCATCVSIPQRIRAAIGSEPLRMLFVVLAIATAGSVGLFWSLMLKRTASAMSAAVLSLSTLYAAPLVVQELFQRFTRVPMERLEWIAYISPFGALPSLGGGRGDTAFGDDIQGVTGGWWLLTLALYLGLSVILIAVSTHLFERVSRRQENRA
nr:ABC transporter permease subunit [PVC group bacterium]